MKMVEKKCTGWALNLFQQHKLLCKTLRGAWLSKWFQKVRELGSLWCSIVVVRALLQQSKLLRWLKWSATCPQALRAASIRTCMKTDTTGIYWKPCPLPVCKGQAGDIWLGVMALNTAGSPIIVANISHLAICNYHYKCINNYVGLTY